MAKDDDLNEGFLKKAVRAVAGKRIAAGRAKETYQKQKAYAQDARETNGGFSDEDEKQLTRMQSTNRRYSRIAAGEKPFRKAKQGEYISKMGEDISSTHNIIEILASANPTADLKDAVYSNLGERVADALNAYKHKIAENYFGQGLNEGTFKDIDTKKKEAARLGGKKPKVQKPDYSKSYDYDNRTPSADYRNNERSRKGKVVFDEATGLQELSKSTLGSYIKKASHDVAHKGAITREFANRAHADRKAENYVGGRKNAELSDKIFNKSWKRRQGMAKAVDKITKEEVSVDEAKKQASIAQKNKAIKAFDKAGKYRPDSKLRFAPLKFKKDRANARLNSQARYNSSPESEAYWSS